MFRGILILYISGTENSFFLNASVVFSVLHIHVHRGGNMHLKIKKEMNYNHFDE